MVFRVGNIVYLTELTFYMILHVGEESGHGTTTMMKGGDGD